MSEAERLVEIELCPVSLQWFDSDPGPCVRCDGVVGVGPVGFAMDEPAGPLCDGCLLKLNGGLGMLMWMAHVVREMAGEVAGAENPLDADRCMVVLMMFAKLFNQGAEWPHRPAPALDLVKELRARLAQVPWDAAIKTFTTPPS